MKIAVVTSVHLPLDGRIFYKQATSLAQAGHQVTLIAPDAPLAAETTQKAGVAYLPLTASGGRFSRPKRWLQIVEILRRWEGNVWHFHDPELLPLLIVCRRLLGRRVLLIYDAHEDVPKDIMDKAWIPRWLRSPLSYIVDKVEQWGIRRCDLIVAATDSIGARVCRFAKRCAIVRNYPLRKLSNAHPVKNSHRNRPVKVIYCGNLTEPRGIKTIVQAMDLLRDHPIELTLLGQLYPREFAEEIVRNAGPNVEIIAKVPFEEVPSYLGKSDIGIVCFQPTPNHLEAMPNKLFEYMEAHLPVIASDFPLWREIVAGAGCGILVNPADVQEIAQGILKLANDPNLRHEMGAAGARAVAERYSWSRESKTLLDAYEGLASTLS